MGSWVGAAADAGVASGCAPCSRSACDGTDRVSSCTEPDGEEHMNTRTDAELANFIWSTATCSEAPTSATSSARSSSR